MDRPAAFQASQQVAKCEVALAADEEVHTRSGFLVGLGREAWIVAASDHRDARLDRANEAYELERGPPLERHARETNARGTAAPDQALAPPPHRALNEDEIGNGDAVVPVDVAGKRGQRSVRHPH